MHRRAAEAEAAGRGDGAEAGGGAQRALRWYKSRPNLSPGRTQFGRGYGNGREGFGRSLFFFPCFDFFSFCFDNAAMKDWVSDLNKNNAELNEKL